MSVVKRIITDSIERLAVDELLGKEFEQAGYGGITLTKTPLGAQINLYTMRPGRVIGRRGRAIKSASERLEQELGISNPQITVVEVEVPELNPRIMASRIANALERGVHFRRALFWSLRRIMESGALGCEIVLRGKLRSDRSRYEKVRDGYIPKAGNPAREYIKYATMHVKLKRGTFGVNVTIVPPDAKFPDKISLEGLPEIEVPKDRELPVKVELEATETSIEPELEKGAPGDIEKDDDVENVSETDAEILQENVESISLEKEKDVNEKKIGTANVEISSETPVENLSETEVENNSRAREEMNINDKANSDENVGEPEA